MEFLGVLLTTVFSFIILFAMAKFLGFRQVTQLSMFDYINGITIGSIAAEMTVARDIKEALMCGFSIVIYAFLSILLSFVSDKSLVLRKFISGTPLLLYGNKKLNYKNFKKAKLDISEFLMQLRVKGHFDLNSVDTVFIEPNGQLSILPVSCERPATPKDINVYPEQELCSLSVILDGKIMDGNLKKLGKNRTWLQENLKKQNISNANEVFLATSSLNNDLCVYIRQ